MEFESEWKCCFYYERDEGNRPMITHCLLETKDGIVIKGTAWCSVKDNPWKERGKEISYNRVLKGLETCTSRYCEESKFWRWQYAYTPSEFEERCLKYNSGISKIRAAG